MAAPTNYYVDPLNGNDTTGDGTIGTPWKSVQKALNTITRNTDNGDCINIKAGAADVVASAWSFTSYGTPSNQAPLVFRGYTSTQGDGGQGVIDCNGSPIITTTHFSGTVWIDLWIKNSTTYLFDPYAAGVTSGMVFINCEFSHAQSSMWFRSSTIYQQYGWVRFLRCYFHDLTGLAVSMQFSITHFDSCYFKNISTAGRYAVVLSSGYLGQIIVENCIFNCINQSCLYLDGSVGAVVKNNTFYSSGGGYYAIEFRWDSDFPVFEISNNLFVNFNNAGDGKGIGLTHTKHSLRLCAHNRFYNVTTPILENGVIAVKFDNTTLASNPLTNPATGDFSVSTDLKALAYPPSFLGSNTNQYLDIGAAQRQEAGGLAINPIGGHFIRGLIQ